MTRFTFHKRNIAIISGIGICAAIIVVFLYLPLAMAIRKNGLECNSLTQQLNAARTNLGVFKSAGAGKKLIREQDISSVIDVIVQEGRRNLLDFKSISQEEILAIEEKHLILPVRIDLEGDYIQLGLFFGALENIKDALVTVEEFRIRQDERILPQISAAVGLNIHLTKN